MWQNNSYSSKYSYLHVQTQIIHLLNWFNEGKYIIRAQFSFWKKPLKPEEDLLALRICVCDIKKIMYFLTVNWINLVRLVCNLKFSFRTPSLKISVSLINVILKETTHWNVPGMLWTWKLFESSETSCQESEVIGCCHKLIGLMLQLKTDYYLALLVIVVDFIWSLDILWKDSRWKCFPVVQG